MALMNSDSRLRCSTRASRRSWCCQSRSSVQSHPPFFCCFPIYLLSSVRATSQSCSRTQHMKLREAHHLVNGSRTKRIHITFRLQRNTTRSTQLGVLHAVLYASRPPQSTSLTKYIHWHPSIHSGKQDCEFPALPSDAKTQVKDCEFPSDQCLT